MKFEDWIEKTPYFRNKILDKLNTKARGELIKQLTDSYLKIYSANHALKYKIRNHRTRMRKIIKQLNHMVTHPYSK